MHYYLKIFSLILLFNFASTAFAIDCQEQDMSLLKAKNYFNKATDKQSLNPKKVIAKAQRLFSKIISEFENIERKAFKELERDCQLTLVDAYLYGASCHFALQNYEASMAYMEELQILEPHYPFLLKTMKKFLDKKPKELRPILPNYPNLAALYDLPPIELPTIETVPQQSTCKQLRDTQYFNGIALINDSSYDKAIELFSEILTAAESELQEGNTSKICELLIRDCYIRATEGYYELSELESREEQTHAYLNQAKTYIEEALNIDEENKLALLLQKKIKAKMPEKAKIEWKQLTDNDTKTIFIDDKTESLELLAHIYAQFPIERGDFMININNIEGAKGGRKMLNLNALPNNSKNDIYPHKYKLNLNIPIRYKNNKVVISIMPNDYNKEKISSTMLTVKKMMRVSGGKEEKVPAPKYKHRQGIK